MQGGSSEMVWWNLIKNTVKTLDSIKNLMSDEEMLD